MQDNRTTSVNRDNKTRNRTNNAVVATKSSNSVAKRTNGAVSAKRASNMHAVRAPRVVNVPKKDKAPFPWSVVVVATIMTGLFLFMMMNYAEVDKYRSEINELDNKITAMKSTRDELEVDLANKYDLEEVKQFAEENGMVEGAKLDKDKQYVTIQPEDKTEMKNYDDGDEGGLGFLLTGLGEVIKDFVK
jgi:cell division protein FtsL